MKKLILLLLTPLCLLLNGCPNSVVKPNDPAATVTSAQQSAEKFLYAAGATLKAAPPILEGLYNAGKISKDDFNKSVPIYNRALASFNVAVNALKACQAAGQDPSNTQAYVAALATFLNDAASMNNLVTALGGSK